MKKTGSQEDKLLRWARISFPQLIVFILVKKIMRHPLHPKKIDLAG